MDKTMVEVDHLSKRFGNVLALQDVSFSVSEGEIFGFLGPNGAGKTTTIRILLGLLRADGGSATVGGYDCWRHHGQAARVFGATLEQPGFYGYLSGRENLRQFAATLGPIDDGRITELLMLVGLAERGNDRVRRYSMGMRQRLAVAQALLGRPRLLILDEPTNGLDPNGIYDLRLLLRQLAADYGLTIFFSSHLLSEVEALCDRVVVVHRGQIRANGPLSVLTGGRSFQYEVNVSDVPRALAIARSIDGVAAETGPSGTSILISSEADVSSTVNAALVSAAIGVGELVRIQRGLEDVYIELTGVAAGQAPSVPRARR